MDGIIPCNFGKFESYLSMKFCLNISSAFYKKPAFIKSREMLRHHDLVRIMSLTAMILNAFIPKMNENFHPKRKLLYLNVKVN